MTSKSTEKYTEGAAKLISAKVVMLSTVYVNCCLN